MVVGARFRKAVHGIDGHSIVQGIVLVVHCILASLLHRPVLFCV